MPFSESFAESNIVLGHTPVIELVGLTKTYGKETVVDKLTLTITAGEIFGFLGPNGSGKTTTLLMLHGLQSTSELYQLSDCCLSAKLVLILADRGCRVVSATDPLDH